jgi:hypothetical protein
VILPGGIKILFALALLLCALIYFLLLIGGGAGGSKTMAYLGLLFGGLGLVATAYSLLLLTRQSLLWWELGIIIIACLPMIVMIGRKVFE